MNEKHPSIEEIHNQVDQLLIRFRAFENASEEFWEVHDKLVKLLYQGIDLSNEMGDRASKDGFRDVLEDLKNSVPSGYWK